MSANPAPSDREFTVTRRRNGVRMAEGAAVRAVDVADALRKARALFPEASCEGDTFEVEEEAF